MTTIHCDSKCKHSIKGICNKIDIIVKTDEFEENNNGIIYLTNYSYCCHRDVKE